MGTPTASTTSRRRTAASPARLRADALFDRLGTPAQPNPSEKAPDAVARVPIGPDAAVEDAAERAHDAGPPSTASSTTSSAASRPFWASLREALLERLPVWVQLRCGLEPKTVVAVAGALAVAAALALHHFWVDRPRMVQVPAAASSAAPPPAVSAPPAAPTAPAPTPGGEVVVDVAGKVHNPGVRRLPSGSRVIDALTAAGGALPGVDTSTLNLARVLADGEQVLVGQPGAPAGAPVTGAGAGGGPAPTGPVRLTTATIDQLETLPGIGPTLARHIIEFRTRHGGFTSISQLRQVGGVGQHTFDELKALVRP